jgi:hypothetical protein
MGDQDLIDQAVRLISEHIPSTRKAKPRLLPRNNTFFELAHDAIGDNFFNCHSSSFHIFSSCLTISDYADVYRVMGFVLMRMDNSLMNFS